jgi:hypothetical protein
MCSALPNRVSLSNPKSQSSARGHQAQKSYDTTQARICETIGVGNQVLAESCLITNNIRRLKDFIFQCIEGPCIKSGLNPVYTYVIQ